MEGEEKGEDEEFEEQGESFECFSVSDEEGAAVDSAAGRSVRRSLENPKVFFKVFRAFRVGHGKEGVSSGGESEKGAVNCVSESSHSDSESEVPVSVVAPLSLSSKRTDARRFGFVPLFLASSQNFFNSSFVLGRWLQLTDA